LASFKPISDQLEGCLSPLLNVGVTARNASPTPPGDEVRDLCGRNACFAGNLARPLEERQYEFVACPLRATQAGVDQEERLAARTLVGTSGWSYKHWKSVFYPDDVASKDWLAYYASRFDTVELNTTFYRTPPGSSFSAWRQHVPPGFIFAVKASRFVTHIKRLNDADETVPRQMESVQPLGPTLGPILFQLPPNMERDVERLAGLLAALPKQGSIAIEFRNESWDHAEVYELLARHDVGVCLHDWHGQPWPYRATEGGAGLVYVRLHGPSGDYGGRYAEGTLENWASRCKQWRADGRDVFCYFNNDAEGNAIRDALALRRLLGEKLPGEANESD
jgi:uncharacterized protein YecE (DUF72 family)